ncbi:MAG: hypothetical protein Q8R00_03205 [Candidatus Nanoarchaeia archaeon]|nr:hypothetical protein [Candidatus Nanoarchaeia archaeon]
MKKRLNALFCMFLVVMIPISSASVYAQTQGEQTLQQFGQELQETKLGIKEPGTYGEDILVQVDSYQPKVLRAGLLEEQDVYVYASLIGTPTNPTITIPAIRNVAIKSVNVSVDPPSKKAPNVRAIRYLPPAQGFIDYRNFGYLVIPISKIPKEHDVPDVINIDVEARIDFDISETITMSRKDLSMPALTEQDWLPQRDQYSFSGGFLRAHIIDENGATLFLYDNQGRVIREPIRLSEGSTSGPLTGVQGLAGLSGAYDRFRIKLNQIRGQEDEVVFLVQKVTGGSDIVRLIKGDRLYDNSDWVVNDITSDDKKAVVTLRNSINGANEKFNIEFGQVKTTQTTEESQFETLLNKARSNLKATPTNQREAYAYAIANYEKVVREADRNIKVDSYSGNLAAQAQREIAEIYGTLGFVNKQKEAAQTLVSNYAASMKDADLIQEKLNALNKVKSETKILGDLGTEYVTISVVDVVRAKDVKKPKAEILINGKSQNVETGATFDLGGTNYKVMQIRARDVLLQSGNTRINVGFDQKQVEISGKKIDLQLKSLDLKRIAYLSVFPEVKRGTSDTNFKLHIPVEKRAVGIPLFSSTIEKEINKTADIINDLDKYINQMEKLHKFWTNLCLITFGTLFAKNLLSGVFGSTAAITRNKVNPEWKEKYNQQRASGYQGSFDQYVSENIKEYNEDYERTKKIVEDINKGNYKNNAVAAELAKTDEAFAKDYYYSFENAKAKPADEVVVKNHLANDMRAQEVKVDGQLSSMQTKQWSELTEQEKLLIGFSAGEGNLENTWKDQSNRREIIATARQKQLQANYASYFYKEEYKKALSAVNVADDTAYADYVKGYVEAKNPALQTADGKKTKAEEEHKGQITVITEGKNDGSLDKISLDSRHYADVKYTTGGRIDSKESYVYERPYANAPMGGPGDARVGDINTVQATTDDQNLKKSLSQLPNCIAGMNNQLSRQKVESGYAIPTTANIGCSLGRYAVAKSAPIAKGPSCVEYMSAEDCKLLFNACDPVICPPTRCNLGGKWQVDNVVETGIVGSAVLCAPNWVVFGGDVVMPVCLTGILAGLQNIKSILQGYNQCLKESQLNDRSVGICDRLRSYYLCEILWREGVALLGTKEGVLGLLIDKVSGASSGGGEYSAFSTAVDSSVGAVGYFTESYAKNVFAGYAGAGFGEVGAEICKAAIFGKSPSVGDLLNSVSRPESPPQFTAFFDAVPYSDVDKFPQSLYTIFYHVYAGENEDTTYSLFMRGTPAPGKPLINPITIVSNRQIKAGEYSSENLERVMPEGFTEICIITTTKLYGTQQNCGPGKVTTDFGMNYLSEQYVKNQAAKQIRTEKECVPENYGSIKGEYQATGALGVAASTLPGIPSAGQLGIVRTCARDNPGVGTDSANWEIVGNCGTDDDGRDLGTCWLYKPSARQALQQEYSREQLDKGLYETQKKVELEGLNKSISEYALDDKTAIDKIKQAKELTTQSKFSLALENLKVVMDKSLSLDIVMVAQFEIGNTYNRWGVALTSLPTPTAKVESAYLTALRQLIFTKLMTEYGETEEDAKEVMDPTYLPDAEVEDRAKTYLGEKDFLAFKKQYEEEQEAEIQTELVEEVVGIYLKQSSDANNKMSNLLKAVGEASKRNIRYGDKAGPLAGLKIPKTNRLFSLADVQDLNGFMELLFDVGEFDSSYSYDITEDEIIIQNKVAIFEDLIEIVKADSDTLKTETHSGSGIFKYSLEETEIRGRSFTVNYYEPSNSINLEVTLDNRKWFFNSNLNGKLSSQVITPGRGNNFINELSPEIIKNLEKEYFDLIKEFVAWEKNE